MAMKIKSNASVYPNQPESGIPIRLALAAQAPATEIVDYLPQTAAECARLMGVSINEYSNAHYRILLARARLAWADTLLTAYNKDAPMTRLDPWTEHQLCLAQHRMDARIEIATSRALNALSDTAYYAYRAVGAHFPGHIEESFRAPLGSASPFDRLHFTLDPISANAYLLAHARGLA